jgi:hypothetical protein
VEYARRTLGATQIHCAGICSGGYHSLKAAVAGLPLAGVVIINPLTFFWKPDTSLSPRAFTDAAEVMRYRRTGLSKKSLRKLFTGNVNLVSLAGTLGRYGLLQLRGGFRALLRRVGVTLRDDLVAELRAVAKQGTRLHFVFSRTDPGYALLRAEAGREVLRLSRLGALSTHYIDGADHTFTPLAAQAELCDLVCSILAAQAPLLS